MELICGTELANEHLKAIESLWSYQDAEILEKEIKSCECGDHEAKYLFIDELGNRLYECEDCLKEIISESEVDGIKYEIIKL